MKSTKEGWKEGKSDYVVIDIVTSLSLSLVTRIVSPLFESLMLRVSLCPLMSELLCSESLLRKQAGLILHRRRAKIRDTNFVVVSFEGE